jgi:O-antigen/teichoic acid export membrane protein
MNTVAETYTPTIDSLGAVDAESMPPARRVSLFGQLLSPGKTLHQTVLSVVDQGVASAANFLSGVIIARVCSKAELGLYMLGFSLLLLLTTLQTSLITTPYMVYAPRLKGKAHALYTGSTLIHQLAFCLVIMLGVMCGALVASSGVGPRGLGSVLWALALLIGLIMLREHARRVSFARLKLTTAFIFDLCIAIGQVGGLLLLAHFRLLSASRAYWVIGSVCGIAVLGWLWMDRGFYEPRIDESITDLKKNWVLGKWVFASGLVWSVAMNIYPWLLAGIDGVASTGIWAACLGVVSIGNPALLGIQNFLGPKISHVYAVEGHNALRKWVLQVAATLVLPLLLFCLVMLVWGGHLLVLLYGKQYAGYGTIVVILSLNFFVTAIAFGFSRALFTLDRARADFLVNFATLFIMIMLGIWLVRAFGPLGAAFGLLGATCAAESVRFIVFLRLSGHILEDQSV